MKTVEVTNDLLLEPLIAGCQKGEEVVLTQNQVPVARIIGIAPASRQPRKAGSLAGEIWMSPDFDAPLEEFKEYME